mmetsp:Transcript_17284/g.42183  ORF Transcript_17284/g.42183 Transcript_17284/m.42183 type:complete len:82 (+) Transcript_17284:1641-1886(+)
MLNPIFYLFCLLLSSFDMMKPTTDDPTYLDDVGRDCSFYNANDSAGCPSFGSTSTGTCTPTVPCTPNESCCVCKESTTTLP